MKKRIGENKLYIITVAIASMAFGAAYGMPCMQDSQAKLLESMHALPSDSIEYSKLLEMLHSSVETELKQRFEKQEVDLKQIEQRLQEAKFKLHQRKDKRFDIVERRVFDLLQKHDDLDWASSTASQNETVLDPSKKAETRLSDMLTLAENMEQSVLKFDSVPPAVSASKRTDIVPSSTADAAPVALNSTGGTSMSSAESGQVIAVMNEALELEATLDAMLDHGFVSLSHPSKKAAASALSKQVRLVELKLDVLQVNKESIVRRFSVELSLGEAMLEVAKQDLEISNQLLKQGAEGFMEHRKKKLEMQVAETRVVQLKIESKSFNDQIDNLAKRVETVRKKYEERFGAKSNSSAEKMPEGKLSSPPRP